MVKEVKPDNPDCDSRTQLSWAAGGGYWIGIEREWTVCRGTWVVRAVMYHGWDLERKLCLVVSVRHRVNRYRFFCFGQLEPGIW